MRGTRILLLLISFLYQSFTGTYQNIDSFYQNGELTLYSYNLADGKDDSLKQRIILNAKKVTRWNNARFHLLNCIAHQKMGLFQHASIQDIPKELHCEVTLLNLALTIGGGHCSDSHCM